MLIYSRINKGYLKKIIDGSWGKMREIYVYYEVYLVRGQQYSESSTYKIYKNLSKHMTCNDIQYVTNYIKYLCAQQWQYGIRLNLKEIGLVFL